MPDTSLPTMDEFIQMIEDSQVLGEDQKVLLVHLLPRLNEEQKSKILEFLSKEKTEFAAIQNKYAAEKAPLYKDYLKQLNLAFKQAEKLVARETEKHVVEGEQKNLDALINSL